MDPRDRADAMLARARARHAFIVTPEDAVSPMDAANTLQIPRAVVDAADTCGGEESTSSMPAPRPRGGRAPAGAPMPAASPSQEGQPVRPASGPATSEPPGPPGLSALLGEPPTQPLAVEAPSGPATQQGRPENQPQGRQLDGLVPTVQETPSERRSLTERLGGE